MTPIPYHFTPLNTYMHGMQHTCKAGSSGMRVKEGKSDLVERVRVRVRVRRRDLVERVRVRLRRAGGA